jgi:hypothetical protein
MRTLKNAVLLLVILGIVGTVAGYFIFARAPGTGELIEIRYLIDRPQSLSDRLNNEGVWGTLESLGIELLSDLETIRRNILLTGAGGALLGLILGFVVSRR